MKSRIIEVWISGEVTKVTGKRPLEKSQKPKYWIWESEMKEMFSVDKCSDYDAYRKRFLKFMSETHTVYVLSDE